MALCAGNVGFARLLKDAHRGFASKTLAKFRFIDLALVLAEVIADDSAIEVRFLILSHRVMDPTAGPAH